MLHVDYLGFIPFNNSICYQSVIAVCLGILISFPRKQCYYWFKLLFLVSFSFIYSLDCLTCCFYICTYGRIAGRSKKALKSPCGPSGHQHKGLQLNVYERLLFWLSNHRISSDHRISKNLTAPLPYYSFYTPPPPLLPHERLPLLYRTGICQYSRTFYSTTSLFRVLFVHTSKFETFSMPLIATSPGTPHPILFIRPHKIPLYKTV